MSLQLTSSAFGHRTSMPLRHTCEGEDVSPPLAWSGEPAGTRSFALIVDDPDAPDPAAPKRVWVHWVVYNLGPETHALVEGASLSLPGKAASGTNDWHRAAWGGPCPPIGEHRYFFKLYALDTVLPDLGEPTKAQLEQAIQGHILAQAELIGLYKKQRA